MARPKRFTTRNEYQRWRYWNDIDNQRKKLRERARLWRINNPEKAREQDRIKREKYYERRKKYQKEYSKRVKRNPLKYAARTILNNALILGRITKPKICSKCGQKKRLNAHHPDYMKPLEVLWLCTKCHGFIHHPF